MADRIFEIGQAGIEAADERIKSMTNNIVNAETPGFKRTDVVQNSFPLELEAATKRLGAMKPKIESGYYDYSGGALIRTGNPTDLAIGEDGFFVIQASFGDAYTRDGRFILDKEGRLVTATGNLPVVGLKGPIVLPPGSRVDISNAGEIKVDGVVADKIRVVSIKDSGSLEPVSGSLFRLPDSNIEVENMDSPRIVQGYIESSNVKMVDEIMNMVMISHLYGIDVKLIQTRDAELSRALEMGKPLQ